KIGETTYQVTLIPLGGYCQFYGEDPSEERSGKEYEFLSAHPLKRIVTVAMGPLFNLFFGVLIFFVMNMVGYTRETNRIYIPEQLKAGRYESPAQRAGLKNGDRIVRINDDEVRGFTDIQSNVFFSEGRRLMVTVERDGERRTLAVTPKKDEESGRFTIGVIPYGTRVMIAGVVENDVAAKAGLREMDELRLVDGRAIATPEEFTGYVKTRANREMSVTVLRSGRQRSLKVTPRQGEVILINEEGPGRGDELLSLMETSVLSGYLEKGKIRVEGSTVWSFEELKSTAAAARGRKLRVTVDGGEYNGYASIERRGFIGVYPVISPEMIMIRYGLAGSLVHAVVEPYEFIVLNLKGIGMLFSGRLNVRENLSGPIRIAKIAGDVAYYKGISAFIILMAKISIILMVMNFLPIPVVDGGHLVFFTVEAIRGKPLSEKTMQRIQTVGVVVLILIGVFVIINDISMLPFIQRFFN
ncbi:MAG: site-2 protease family protein, partial [Spirochaetes bacterium]|nr:site-2 protease family protein [Spirochaetota bacterium]